MKKTKFISIATLLALSLFFLNPANATQIHWIDVSTIPGASDVTILDPVLGQIRVTTDSPAQMDPLPPAAAKLSTPDGSLGSLEWASFDYINYNASNSGIRAPIAGTMMFEFLDGPIDTTLTPLYFSSTRLRAASSYIIDNDPTYLGDIEDFEGTGTYTPLGGDLLRINGNGNNHNSDLFQFDSASISSISIVIDQVRGDRAGFTIGAGLPIDTAPVPLPASLWFLISGLITLFGFKKSGNQHVS